MNLNQAMKQLRNTAKELKDCIKPEDEKEEKNDAKIIQMIPKDIEIKNKVVPSVKAK